MKKVININFSNRLINIEEDAYSSLLSYIESLKYYFRNEDGKEEIIADIENRIAEIFSEKHRKGVASITTNDVNEVAQMIGRPEDFEANEDNDTAIPKENAYATSSNKFVTRGKLQRDGKDKLLGGVCSGIAAYLNIDTVLVRIIFAILFFGAGSGLLLYIILWIVLPESKNVVSSIERKLYRNTDDKMFGGVASGLSSYFNIDMWIPRLIFAAPFLISLLRGVSNFAFHTFFWDGYWHNRFWSLSFGSTTTVVYFLLWWIIPEAKTKQEKMAMKGEKMNLNSFKENVQEGIKNFSNKATDWGNDISKKTNEWSKQFSQKAPEYTERAGDIIRTSGNKIGSGIGLLIKAFFLFIGGLIAFSLCVSFFGLLIGGSSFWSFKGYILENNTQTTLLYFSILSLIMPILLFVLWILKNIVKVKANFKLANISFTILLIIGVISSFLLASILVKSFSYTNEKLQPQELAISQPTNKLMLKVSEPEIIYSGNMPFVHFDEDEGFDISTDSLKLSNVKIIIEKSNDSSYHTFIKKFSRGSNVSDANKRAEKINYNLQQIGNTLHLGSGFAISQNEKFRAQQIIVMVQVPVGHQIEFDETLEKLHPFNVQVTERRENGRRVYRKRKGVYVENDDYFNYELNKIYVMNTNGELENINKKAIEKSNNDDDNQNNLEEKKKNLEKEVEDKKREIENEKQKEKLNKEIEDLQHKKDSLEQLQANSNFIKNPTLVLNKLSMAFVKI